MIVDMLLENCKIIREEEIIEANVAVENGKIHGIVKDAGSPQADEKIDMRGKIVIPGCIDPHVHFRDPGYTHKEDFETGSLSAAFGGVTTVFDMPNTKPRTASEGALKEKREIAKKKSCVDYALHYEVTDDNCEGLLDAFVYKGYLDYGKLSYEGLGKALHLLEDKIVCVHAEDYANIDESKYTELPGSHSIVRSNAVEVEAIKKILDLCFGSNTVHFCHVSTGEGLGLILGSQKRVSCEVAPHHLFLDLHDYEKLGSFAKVNPSLKSPADREALWENLKRINYVASDHAPHTKVEKDRDIRDAAAGFAGVETTLPLLLNAVSKGRLCWEDLVRLTSGGAAEQFGLNKGLDVGKDADLVVVDRKKEWRIKAENLHSKCGWTPYEGWDVKGSVEKVFLRGEPIIDMGEFLGKKGEGEEI